MTGNEMTAHAMKLFGKFHLINDRPVTRTEAIDMLYNETNWAGPSITAIVDELVGPPIVYREKVS